MHQLFAVQPSRGTVEPIRSQVRKVDTKVTVTIDKPHLAAEMMLFSTATQSPTFTCESSEMASPMTSLAREGASLRVQPRDVPVIDEVECRSGFEVTVPVERKVVGGGDARST